MKKIIFISLCFWLCQASCWAETGYVTDVMPLNMRKGPGTEHKIITVLKAGEKVDILEKSDRWAKVRTESGMEGWVSAGYLKIEKQAMPVSDDVTPTPPVLFGEGNPASAETDIIGALKEDNQRLQRELAEKEAGFATINSAYEKLKDDCKEFIADKSNPNNAQKELSDLKNRYKELEDVVIKLQNSQFLKGISIGAGILVLGIIMGFGFKRQRRRSSLLS